MWLNEWLMSWILEFTIQNVPIKFPVVIALKLFFNEFTIQNVPIKLYFDFGL